VDFSDDAHLAAAVAKNKQTLLGKKLSIARSDPKRGKKEHGRPNEFFFFFFSMHVHDFLFIWVLSWLWILW
jgi:hypothetical protein